MNRKDLIERIASEAGISRQQAEAALSAFQRAIAESLAEGRDVSLTGFGRFAAVERAARTSRNPRTGEAVEVPARRAPKFTPGSQLKEAVAS